MLIRAGKISDECSQTNIIRYSSDTQARSVRVCDISEQNLVPSISMLSNNNHDFSVLV